MRDLSNTGHFERSFSRATDWMHVAAQEIPVVRDVVETENTPSTEVVATREVLTALPGDAGEGIEVALVTRAWSGRGQSRTAIFIIHQ